jgi:hypothetical protein
MTGRSGSVNESAMMKFEPLLDEWPHVLGERAGRMEDQRSEMRGGVEAQSSLGSETPRA